MPFRSPALPIIGVLWMLVAGCAGEAPAPESRSSRGYVLVSIDTLRADRLGAYGYERDTSPFFDSLAARGVLFENAFAQLPGTLPSHMSIFTGLYPAQHGVYPPNGALSRTVVTLPEALLASGYRTAGFTEGGYVKGEFGFDRGFEEFADDLGGSRRSVEEVFARGLAFLDSLEPEEPFFLFLHTYAVHDPYSPPGRYRTWFWQGEEPEAFEPTGPNLVEVNRGRRPPPGDVELSFYEALYDGGIRYVDDQLRGLLQGLSSRGLTGDTTIVITSDHGEEFLEHGKLVHEQVYRETLQVPLLVVGPGIGNSRVGAMVESVDIAPTLIDLAGLPPLPGASGRSLRHLLAEPTRTHRGGAYGEAFVTPTRTLYTSDDTGTWQVVANDLAPPGEDPWVGRELDLDVFGPVAELRVHSYHEPRNLTVSVDGQAPELLALRPDDWTSWRRELGDGLHRLRLSADGCVAPSAVGQGDDDRCLAFKISGPDLRRWELYRLDDDPDASRDLAASEPAKLRKLAESLLVLRWDAVAPAGEHDLPDDLRERLESLGYLQ